MLRQDHPAQLERIIKDTLGVTYLQVLDKEEAVLLVRKSGIKVRAKVKKSQVNIRVSMSRVCLFDLLEGRLTLEQAIAKGQVIVFGDPKTLLRCYGVWERVISLARTSPRLYFLTYKLR